MTNSFRRRIDDIDDRTWRLSQVVGQQSTGRLQRGERRAIDIECVFGDRAEWWQPAVLAALPLWIARRRNDRDISCWQASTPQLPMALVDPPGEPQSNHVRSMVDEVLNRWRTEPAESAMDWVENRITLGADGGEHLRNRAWDFRDGAWVVSDEVVDAASSLDSSTRPQTLPLGPLDQQLVKARLGDLDARCLAAMFHLAPDLDWPRPTTITALECAVLIDPDDDPPWLSRTGREALQGDWTNHAIQICTDSQPTADKIAGLQAHWRWARRNWRKFQDDGTELGRWFKALAPEEQGQSGQ